MAASASGGGDKSTRPVTWHIASRQLEGLPLAIHLALRGDSVEHYLPMPLEQPDFLKRCKTPGGNGSATRIFAGTRWGTVADRAAGAIGASGFADDVAIHPDVILGDTGPATDLAPKLSLFWFHREGGASCIHLGFADWAGAGVLSSIAAQRLPEDCPLADVAHEISHATGAHYLGPIAVTLALADDLPRAQTVDMRLTLETLLLCENATGGATKLLSDEHPHTADRWVVGALVRLPEGSEAIILTPEQAALSHIWFLDAVGPADALRCGGRTGLVALVSARGPRLRAAQKRLIRTLRLFPPPCMKPQLQSDMAGRELSRLRGLDLL